MGIKSKSKNEDRKKVATVIDEYGVILHDLYEGDKIVTKNQTDYCNKYISNFKQKEAFVKVFTNPITVLFKELPTKEFAVAMAIMPFIGYKDGILKINSEYADIKEISEVLNENYDTFRKTISSLIKRDILGKIDRQIGAYKGQCKKCIVVNPYIFLRGQDIEKDIVEKFKNSKWAKC